MARDWDVAGAGVRVPDGSLLERERELAALDELIGTVVGGQSALGVVEGPAGIGKSRLMVEAKRRAAGRGMSVLSAVATEFEQGFGFGVVGQLFEPAVHDDPERLLGGVATAAGTVLTPGWGEQSEPGSDQSFASLHGLYWLTVRLSELQPVLLSVDDLHWCDVPSLRFLAYLQARLDHLPVLVLGSLRPVSRGSDVEAVVAAIVDRATVRLRPRPLSDRAATKLLERGLGARPDAAFAAACHQATGGNPLLLAELVKVLDAEGVSPADAHLPVLKDLGPTSVPRTVLLRLQRLEPAATAVAQALTILGDGADLAAVAALAGLDVEDASRATAALSVAEILRPDPPLGFVHPVIADAVYRDVLPGKRELLHARAAELLAVAAPSERVAAHLLHAPATGATWVVDELVRAAGDASRSGATSTAVAYLRRALAEPPSPDQRAEVLVALGRAEMLGDGEAAAEHLRAAFPLLTEPEQRVDVAWFLARALLFTGAGDDAVRVLREAVAQAPPRLRSAADSLVAYELFCGLYFGFGDDDVPDRLVPYRTAPIAAGVGASMLAAIAAQGWMYECGPSNAIGDLALASLASGELVAADTGWAAAFPLTVLTLADRPEAEHWWEQVVVTAHRQGSVMNLTSVSVGRAFALRRQGELDEAEHQLMTCRGSLRDWGYHERMAEIFCDAQVASLFRERGDLVGARRELGERPDPGRADEGARQWYGSDLELLVAEGAFEAAVAAAGAYAERFDCSVRNPMDVPWRSLQALALGRLGRHDEARELAWAELELARAWGAPGTVARTLRTLGTIEGRDGIEHLEEAVAVVAGSPARLEHARALTALGGALRRWRQPSTARVHLRTALEMATVFGAETLASDARRELGAAGGRPRRTALTGVGSLTVSERRVALLAAEERTNREIGETLFVSPKTVAMHLSNVYRKLGVTSRRHLAGALADD